MSNAPLFDSSKSALDFALNKVVAKMPRPFMTKAMAEFKVKPKKLSKKKRAQLEKMEPEALELLDAAAKEGVKRASGLRPPPLSELEGAATAGFILRHVERLDPHQRNLLIGVTLIAYQPCACGAACCSGFRADPRWVMAMNSTVEALAAADDVVMSPIKKGLSTKPSLRQALVHQFLIRRSEGLHHMAATHQLSTTTVALHRDLVTAWLQRLEDESWFQLDAIFDQVGITGHIET